MLEQSDQPVEVKPDAPQAVAVVGEIPFAGRAVARALLNAGTRVRVLCPDDAALAAVASLEQQDKIEAVRGDLGSAEAIARALTGAAGVCFVSPINLSGRMYRSHEHLEDVRRVMHAAETLLLRKVVYLSSVGASPTAHSRALRDAAAAEELIGKSHCEDYRIRSGPLMGSAGTDDRFLSEFSKQAQRGSPFMTILGYGSTLVQPLHTEDFAASIARIFADRQETLRNGIYEIGGPLTVSVLDLTDRALVSAQRSKIKFHAPLFVLQLVAKLRGEDFKERVAMLFETLAVEKNEIPRLLGVGVQLKDAEFLTR